MALEQRKDPIKMFGGDNILYQHQSKSTGTRMQFAVFVPPQAKTEKVPVRVRVTVRV